MTEEKAIELATQFQTESGGSKEFAGAHRVTQAQMDAFEKAHGKRDPKTDPDYMRREAHWVVFFYTGWNAPEKHVISVYDDGVVSEMPGM